MLINTNQPVSYLNKSLNTKSADMTDGFDSILSDSIAKQTLSSNNAKENVSNSFEQESVLSTVNSLTSTTTNDTSSLVPISSGSKKDALIIDPSLIAQETQETTGATSTDDAVKVEINGDTLTFTVDMSKTNNVSINIKKNDDGSYTFDITEIEEPETPAETEEWMVEGHNYENTAPAYSPVTGNPLNVTVGEFIKMIDYASWDAVSKTHSGAPTGQSWELFQSMLTSGLDPYITMFY